MKIGIFVGSFDPPTKAHFDIAHMLYNKRIIDKVIFVPVNNSKKKLVKLDKRIEMLNNYIKFYNYLAVSSVMTRHLGNFNYQVLEELSKNYNNIYLIMGSDLLEVFSSFINYQMMLEKYHFVIIPRFNIDHYKIIKEHYKDYFERFVIIDYNNDISSSMVRERISNNECIVDMVYDNIEKYINEEGLYRDGML